LLISSMLNDSSYERPDSVSTIRSRLKLYLNPEADQQTGRIEETQFQKSGSATTRTDAATPGLVQALAREKRTISATTAVSIFLILIVLIGGVFFYLPSKVSPVSNTTVDADAITTPATGIEAAGNVSSRPEETTSPAPFELAQLEHYKEEARALAAKILRTQISLEDTGALLWAEDKMQSVQNLADEGDLLFRDKVFEDSLGKYQQSLSILEALKVSIPDVLAEYLATGHEALEGGDASTAINAFTIVLFITPDDADAATSLARAQTLEEVLQLLGSARELEAAEQLQEALAAYQEARSIDPLWPAASEGVRRISGKITRRNFNQEMSTGFNELEQSKFDTATQAFSRAQSLIPDSQLPADGLHQVDLAFRLQKIEKHKTQADQFAQQENWSGAITEYQNALDLDSNLIFANRGLEHSRECLQMSNRL
jgi:tetratricopeptide (TPR) repeat protein